jgi:hypothetical protein
MTRRRALWALGLATVGLFVVLALLDRRMQHAGGHGIVSFELAGSRERAREMLADWGADGRDAARASLWVDYLFLAAYGTLLWLAILALRDGAMRRGWARFARPGGAIALLALAGAACDAAEDAFLLLALGGHGGAAAPRLATAFASVKFACLTVAVVYLLTGLVALGVARRGSRARA